MPWDDAGTRKPIAVTYFCLSIAYIIFALPSDFVFDEMRIGFSIQKHLLHSFNRIVFFLSTFNWTQKISSLESPRTGLIRNTRF